MSKVVRIIVLGNGAAGAEKQAFAFGTRLQAHLQRAGAVCLHDSVELVRVPLRGSIVGKLPPAVQLAVARVTRDPFIGYELTAAQRTALLPPARDAGDSVHVVIGCGRSTVALCAALRLPWARENHAAHVYNVQIQHPRTPLSLFDAVIVPRHDVSEYRQALLKSSVPRNLHLTLGTVGSVLDERALEREGEQWRDELAPYLMGKLVRLVWLVGGACRGFAFTEEQADAMTTDVLAAMARFPAQASLLVTFSRRTPSTVQTAITNRLRRALHSDHELFIWDGHGRNPYDALLFHGTAIVTTPDSVSMLTEAVSTGKPVFTVGASDIRGKFVRLHRAMVERGFAIPLTADALQRCINNGTLEASKRTPQQAMEEEVQAITAGIAAQILR